MIVYPALAGSEYIPDFGAPTFLGDVSEEWSETLSDADRKAVDLVDVHRDASETDGGEETNLYEYISEGIDPKNLHLLPWYRVEFLMEEQGVEV
jgi:hypothetical protein